MTEREHLEVLNTTILKCGEVEQAPEYGRLINNLKPLQLPRLSEGLINSTVGKIENAIYGTRGRSRPE